MERGRVALASVRRELRFSRILATTTRVAVNQCTFAGCLRLRRTGRPGSDRPLSSFLVIARPFTQWHGIPGPAHWPSFSKGFGCGQGQAGCSTHFQPVSLDVEHVMVLVSHALTAEADPEVSSGRWNGEPLERTARHTAVCRTR